MAYEEFTEEQQMIRETARKFAEQQVAPLVDHAEETGKFPVELFRKAGEMGLLCIRYPLELGGGGADKVSECILAEALNRVCAGIGAGLMVQGGLATNPIYEFGSDELKQKYLHPAITGEKIGCFALTEPDVGSDAASLKTRATRDGDFYVLQGNKTFITNGNISDYAVVAATVDPAKKGAGVCLFVVEKGTPGFTVTRKLDKVGNRSADTAELSFEGCRVPAKNLIGGKEGVGFMQVTDTLTSGRITYGARCAGLAQAAYEASVKYAQQRVQFGKPIITFEVNRFKLAQMAMKIDVMRAYTYRVARLYDVSHKVAKEASMVKLFCSENLQQILADAMQIHGGYGYMMEYPVQRYWRDGRLFTITEGTSEIHHLVIAREMGF